MKSESEWEYFNGKLMANSVRYSATVENNHISDIIISQW